MRQYKLTINGHDYDVRIDSMDEAMADVTVNGTRYSVGLNPEKKAEVVRPVVSQPSVAPSVSAAASASVPAGTKAVKSPLPGVILSIAVAVGDKVVAGQKVAVLEAMKMENEIETDKAGTVTAIHVATGESVPEGAPIITIG